MRMRIVSLLLVACAITAIMATPSWAATKTLTLYVLQTGTCEDRDHTRWVLSLRKSNGLECAIYTDEGEPGAFRATENYITDRKIARQLARTGRVTGTMYFRSEYPWEDSQSPAGVGDPTDGVPGYADVTYSLSINGKRLGSRRVTGEMMPGDQHIDSFSFPLPNALKGKLFQKAQLTVQWHTAIGLVATGMSGLHQSFIKIPYSR